jgi:hypothetical protein
MPQFDVHRNLGPMRGSVADQGQVITDALDGLLTRSCG